VQRSEEVAEGLRFYRTRSAGRLFSRVKGVRHLSVIKALTRRLLKVAQERRPDLLHAHSPALNGVSALRVGNQLKLPVVYEVRAFWEDAAVDHGTATEGGLRYRLTRALETHVLNRAHAVTTISEGLRRELVERGLPQSKVTVIPNAVDPERFHWRPPRDKELEHRLGLLGAIVLGFIGSFYSYEGLELLLEAMPEILRKQPRARALLVGGGPHEKALKRKAAALGIERQVVFTGRVPHSEVRDYYGLTDICVYPRYSMRLTELVTPLKPLEAMAHGNLVVASDVGGHRELIRPGVTGELFPPGDREALAAAVLRLLADHERWEDRRQAGRHFIETERSWRVVVGGYRDVYSRALGSVNLSTSPSY
jgi:PEP-CTERM/exosortase A-associated glycosyltransferase